MNIVFFGSSKYSVIDERALHEKFGLSFVVTSSFPNPVKEYAEQNSIPCIATEKLTEEVIEQIARYQPDFLVVADFGLILPKKLLDLPKKAAINVHHSLLPKYRGVAPVPFAILAGEKTVGVTIILMTPNVDAGDMLAQTTYTLNATDTTDSVLTKLNELGSLLVVEALNDFDKTIATKKVQDETLATSTHMMSRQDGFIDVQNPPTPQKLDRMIRAYFPWPGVWFKASINNQEIRIKLLPGKMLQPEGKKPMSYKDFMNGYTEGKELLEKLQLI